MKKYTNIIWDWNGTFLNFIGDTLHDAEVSVDMGTDCILLTHGHQHHERLLSCGFPVIHSFSELFTYL